MKHVIRLSFVAVFAMLAITFAEAQQSSPVQVKKLSDRLYSLLGGSGANGGFYIGDNGVLVIDSKMNEQSQEDVFAAIKKVTDKPIIYLVNTHADGDHVNGNVYFPENVTIVSHENCRAEFLINGRDGKPSNWLAPGMAKGIPSVTYSERMTLYLGSKKVELFYFGVGHTTGDTFIWFPDESVAFIGDQYFEGRVPLFHTYKGGSAVAYLSTMDAMLATIPAKQFCSGHADIVSVDKVKAHLENMRAKVEKVQALVRQGKSVNDVKAQFTDDEAALIEGIYNNLK